MVPARVWWYLLGCGGVHENGQGSAIDIVRRNWVRQISESDVGMFDMVFRRSLVSLANHKLSHGLTNLHGNEVRVCFAGGVCFAGEREEDVHLWLRRW